ncbi:MAG: CoA-binding protein [Candidatus Kapabacteria bacterium]|nr:CoA-binding protein [Candidatus Kapabacteria bacterium]
MNSKQIIDNFTASEKFALVGASTNPAKFGNAILKLLQSKGKTIYPIHTFAPEIESTKTFRSFLEFPDKVENLILCIKKEKVVPILQQAKEAGIVRVWLQQGTGSTEALKFCMENAIQAVNNECIFMFLEGSMHIHKVHKWINKLIGKYPK